MTVIANNIIILEGIKGPLRQDPNKDVLKAPSTTIMQTIIQKLIEGLINPENRLR